MFKNFTGSWGTSTIAKLATATTSAPTYYLRTQLTVQKELYSGYLMKLVHRSGVIIRINGIEIFREFLPTGNVDQTTLATGSHPLQVEEKFMLPIKDLEEGGIISLELHKATADTFFPTQDKVFIVPLDGDNDEDCVLLPLYDAKITDTSSVSCNVSINCVETAFDLQTNIRNYWQDDYGNVQGQSYATLQFGERNHYGFNQFYMEANTLASMHYPTQAKVFGLDGTAATLFYDLNPVYYFKDSAVVNMARASFNTDPYKLWTGAKIEIPKSNQPTTPYKMQVSEIGYHLCRYRTCDAIPAESLPIGESNHMYDFNCTGTGVAGTRKFYCSNKRNWIEIENTCNETPTFIDPPTTKTYKRGETLIDEALFLVSGQSISYTYSGSIYIYIYIIYIN